MTDLGAMMPLSSIVLDDRLYPRVGWSAIYIHELTNALRAGAQFPPLVVDNHTNILIDGYHRYRAYLTVYGADHSVPVEIVDCPDEQQRFLLAIQLNAQHGKRLDTRDKAHIVHIADDLGISRDVIAGALQIERNKLDGIVERRTVYIEGRPYPLGRSQEMLAGRDLPAEFGARLKRSEGRYFGDLVKHLLVLLEIADDGLIAKHQSSLRLLMQLMQARLDLLEP